MSASQIYTDIWLNVTLFLNVKEFVSLQRISKYFCDITDESKHGLVKRYWKTQSKKLFSAINAIHHVKFNDSFDTPNWYRFYLATRSFYIDAKKIAAALNTGRSDDTLLANDSSQDNFEPDWIIATCDTDNVLIFQMLICDNPNLMIKMIRKPKLERFGSSDDVYYVEPKRRHMSTVFWRCCEYGSITIIKYLLDNIDIFTCIPNEMIAGQGGDGDTPLSVACLHGHVSVAKLLFHHPIIKSNNNRHSRGKYNSRTALHCAVSAPEHDGLRLKAKLEIISMLLDDEKVDVNAQTDINYKDINTPLMLAASCRSVVTDLLLSDARVDINVVTRDNRAAIGVAIRNQNKYLIKKLLARKDLYTTNAGILDEIKKGLKSTDYSIEKMCEECLYKAKKQNKTNQTK